MKTVDNSKTERILTHAEHVFNLKKAVILFSIDLGYSDQMIAEAMNLDRSSVYRVRKQKRALVPNK
jgi:hypothetical protein